jgi:hypothetical protein
MIKDGSKSSIKYSPEVIRQAQNLAEETGEEIVLTKKYKQYLVGSRFEKLTQELVLVDWAQDFVVVYLNDKFSSAEMMQFDIRVDYKFYSGTTRPTIVVYVENPIAISGLK